MNTMTILTRDSFGDLKDVEYFDAEVEDIGDYLNACATVDIEVELVDDDEPGCGVHARPGGQMIKHTHDDGSISYAIFYEEEPCPE